MNDSKCENCSKECTSSLGCRRSTCNLCYSNNYTNCTGYLIEHHNENEKMLISASNLGKNCKVGIGFNCSECFRNFINYNGLCINNPNLTDTIILSLQKFEMFQGKYFQSGKNASTYSLFNNPEEDDPIALSSRVYMFSSGKYMTAHGFALNYSFTIAA